MKFNQHRFVIIASLGSLLAIGCGEEPVSYSAPVGIELKADSDKVVDGVLTDEKGISTESGNPYAAFVAEARNRLGRTPARIEISEVSALLGAGSTGVTSLGAIFDGRVDVLFETDTTKDTLLVAHGTIDAADDTGGPVMLDVDFYGADIVGTNWDDVVAGKFKVVYRGPVQPDFAGLDAKGNLQITLSFEAFE